VRGYNELELIRERTGENEVKRSERKEGKSLVSHFRTVFFFLEKVSQQIRLAKTSSVVYQQANKQASYSRQSVFPYLIPPRYRHYYSHPLLPLPLPHLNSRPIPYS